MNIISVCSLPRLLRLWKLPGALLLLLAVNSLRAAWDFATIMQKTDALYGPANAVAQQRINAWQQLLIQLRNADEKTQLREVNRFFNIQLRYAEDSDIWHSVDYWATPVESLRKGEADCEDYAIAKYFTLRQLGVADDKLRITY
ncbi:transglutaminase-like cysteine peptidase, partial [Citrobacter werkmanii]|nr:transglutaminase-like cysteine peptidase [Citrobacter werkmanii]